MKWLWCVLFAVLAAAVGLGLLSLAVFVCGTAAECIGLSEIDFRKIGEGKTGPITRAIQNVFHDAIRGKLAQYDNWLSYVEQPAMAKQQVSVKTS